MNKFFHVTLLTIFFANCANADFGGEISFENRYFPKDIASSTGVEKEDYNLSTYGRFYLENTNENFSYKLSAFGRFDALDEKRRFFSVEDLYLEKNFTETMKLALGYKVYNFSVLEIFHPTDILNSRNFDGDFERLEKRGEMSLEYGLYSLTSSLSFYYFPLVEKNIYPGAKSRFGYDRTFDTYKVTAEDEIVTNKRFHPQYGVKANSKISDFDLSFFYFKHIDRNHPLFLFDDYITSPMLLPKNSKAIVPYLYEVQDYGFSLVGEISGTLLKFESVYHDLSKPKEALLYDGARFVLFAPDNYMEGALGLEYLISLENGHDVTLFAEWQKILFEKNSYQKMAIAFQDDLALGLRYALNDIAGTEFYTFILGDLSGREEGVVSAKLSRRFNERIRYEVAGRYIWAQETDNFGLRALKDDHYLSFNLRYFY